MAEELKLLPCPFCGCEVGLVTGFAYHVVRGDHALTCVFLDEEPVATAEEWNTRTQLPSQGGEAVAEYQQLSRYGNWDRIDKVAFDLGKLGSCPEKFRAIYTRPADQVAEGVKPEPIQVEAVAVTREDEDGELYLDWLIEGGISALEVAGQTLLIAHGKITDGEGGGEVYTVEPAHSDVSVTRELSDAQCEAITTALNALNVAVSVYDVELADRARKGLRALLNGGQE
jgi:hypothetical protein